MMRQVLPEWSKEHCVGVGLAGPINDVASEKARAELAAFMLDAKTVEQRRKAKRTLQVEPRLHNQTHLQAYEHTLVGGLNINTAYFVPSRPCRALQADEQREYVESASVPDEAPLPADDPPGRKRSVVVNTATGEKWIEVPRVCDGRGRLHRPCLHTPTDKGPKCFPGLQWLCTKMDVRGCLVADWQHQDCNGLKSAIAEAGLWMICLER